MKKAIYITGIFLLLLSCKKDGLKDGKEILIGTWNWNYSERSFGWCENETLEETYTPVTEGKNFSIMFFKNGFVGFLEDKQVVARHRIVFYSFDNSVNPTTFDIYLDNNSDDRRFEFSGEIHNEDMLKAWVAFPFNYEHSCEQYISYFIKE